MEKMQFNPEEQALLDSLKEAIIALNDDEAAAIAEKVVASNIDPKLAIRYAIADAAVTIGEKFDSGEYFLPHLVMSGDLMDVITKILERNIPKSEIDKKKVIVIATVQADVHSVGKNLVSTMLKSVGFDIVDMGVDVPSATIIAKAKEVSADIIALSSLLTTTMPYQKEVIDDLVSMGLRDRFKVMIGGGPVTKEYAKRIGADGYGRDAIEAVDVAKQLLNL
ncbi:MAG: cobalamin B12-binding domain-containing protein [Syntrophales bacterium]